MLLFLYEVSIVVLVDFIAILLSPGIFLIQIVNRNMYLIYFYIILKCIFQKLGFHKVSKLHQTFIFHQNVVK